MRSSFNTESVALASVGATAVADVLPLLTGSSGALSACRDSAFVSSLTRLSNPDGSSNRSLIVCYKNTITITITMRVFSAPFTENRPGGITTVIECA